MRASNIKAMREALKQIIDRINSLDEDCGVDPVEIRDIARAALSAPPRNCDRFATAKDAFAELDKLCEKTTCGYCRFRKYEGFECMFAWLFAEAKGGEK